MILNNQELKQVFTARIDPSTWKSNASTEARAVHYCVQRKELLWHLLHSTPQLTHYGLQVSCWEAEGDIIPLIKHSLLQ